MLGEAKASVVRDAGFFLKMLSTECNGPAWTVSAEVEDVPFNWKLIRLDGLDWSTILDPNKNPESFALIRVEL